MKVKEVMKTEVITLPAHLTYEEAARVLYHEKISGAPVVAPKGVLLGVVSEKDLFRLLYPSYQDFYKHPEAYTNYELRENKMDELRRRPISEIVAREIHTVTPEMPILKAGALMLSHNLHRLPVVSENKLVGIITRDHIFRSILKKHLPL